MKSEGLISPAGDNHETKASGNVAITALLVEDILGGIRRLKKLLNDSIGLSLLMNFVAPVTNAKELTGTYCSCS